MNAGTALHQLRWYLSVFVASDKLVTPVCSRASSCVHDAFRTAAAVLHGHT
jgi:hypothetical protein